MRQLYLVESDGKHRKGVVRKCELCGNRLLDRAVTKEPKRFCSQQCRSQARTKLVSLLCANCKKEFAVKPSRRRNSKSDLFFCSRKCKDKAQRIGGIREIMPPHYGTGCGKYNYRRH